MFLTLISSFFTLVNQFIELDFLVSPLKMSLYGQKLFCWKWLHIVLNSGILIYKLKHFCKMWKCVTQLTHPTSQIFCTVYILNMKHCIGWYLRASVCRVNINHITLFLRKTYNTQQILSNKELFSVNFEVIIRIRNTVSVTTFIIIDIPAPVISVMWNVRLYGCGEEGEWWR